MSLILEALRKSEAERRLGQAPDLLAPMPVLRVPATRRRWPAWVAGACILAVAMASAWWWMRATSTTPSAPVTRPAAQPAPNGTNASVAATPAGDAQLSSTSIPASQSPVILLPAANVPVAAAIARKPVAALPMPKLAGAPLPPTPALASATTIAPKPGNEPIARLAPAATASTAAPPALAPTDEPSLATLADLSPDERNGLPALKVSMHVYADEPAQRFMIVDGQRVGEGARMAAGVILVHIRRDGAEIDVHGRRLLLPKP